MHTNQPSHHNHEINLADNRLNHCQRNRHFGYWRYVTVTQSCNRDKTIIKEIVGSPPGLAHPEY